MPQSANIPRQRKFGRKQKKIFSKSKKLPGGINILGRSLRHLWRHKRLFLLAYGVYALLYVVLVRGLALSFQLGDTKALLEESLGTELGTVETATSLFGMLLGTAGTVTSEAAGIYQFILLIIMSLAIIWMLRATYESKDIIKVKQAFYNSTSQLIPYLLVVLVLVLQSLPALVSLSLYSIVQYNGLAVGALEQIVWFIVLVFGILLSLYLLASSIFATYIVTLPGALPMGSLRAARKLVKYRRLQIFVKLLFFAVLVAIFMTVVFFPLVLLAPVVAEILFLIVSLSGIFILHAYLYTVYRELL